MTERTTSRPRGWLYRHDEIVTQRPYGVDVDRDGWLWEGCAHGQIVGHHLRTNALRVLPLPTIGRHPIYQVFAWDGKLVLTLGACPFYVVLDPATGACVRKSIPAARPIVWYGVRTPRRLLLFERSESKVLVLDGPDAEPRVVACPYPGQLAAGEYCSDGLVYGALADPARMIRFDPAEARFIDEAPVPFADAGLSGKVEHRGVLYCADSAGGRLLPLDIGSGRWQDPVPTPDYRSVYGFIGGGFGFKGRAYYCLSTYMHRSRLDPKTGRIVMPEGPLAVDGRAPRFLDRFLVFDPESRTFDYLVADPQPDGIPMICYAWADDERFAITGITIPFAEPGVAGEQVGPWFVLQSEPAGDEPGFAGCDLTWDRAAHVRRSRRSYGRSRSVFLPKAPHVPPTSNLSGPATHYAPGLAEALRRRAGRTDGGAYWRSVVETVVDGAENDAARVRAIAAFVRRYTYYNPIQEPENADPIALLEGHDIRCGAAVRVLRALFDAAGIESRATPLFHHTVAEARYDGEWHMADALFFGSRQPSKDGRVLSVAELQADVYLADGWPQDGFLYDPEELLSEDGFQVLGYVFGPWGAYPYYSWYLGAPADYPPTQPVILPVRRGDGSRVRIAWAPAARRNGGAIEYDVRIADDRAIQNVVFRATTDATEVLFDVPERNRMYYIEVRSMDAHRQLNPATWYPPSRSNFVLVPPEQYGWYGVL